MNLLGGKTEEKKEEPAKKAAPEVGQMQKGDYMIHVYLQDGKQFKGSNDAPTTTPMIQVVCGGKSKYSTSKKDISTTSSVYWGEHLFFEKSQVSKNEIESMQIQIKVLNKGTLKDDVIGLYEFDVTYIYFQDKHTLFNQWIALSNPEGKDFNEITCYLRLGIAIQGPGDEQVPLNDQTALSTEETEMLMPASIKKVYKQIKMRFVKGEKLPQMDRGGTIDAFIETVFFKKKLKTKPVTQSKNTQECAIEQEFWLPVQWPLASDRLVLKIYDYDKIGSNEIVGSMYFSLKKFVNDYGEEGTLQWFNVYGSPLGKSGAITNEMNEFPEIASTWKGRILMNISSFDTKNPEMKLGNLDQEYKQQLVQSGAFNLHEYEILAEIGSGICLPGQKKKFKVRIQINDLIIETKDPMAQSQGQESYYRWNFRSEVVQYKAPYKSIQELDRVYIYLIDNGEPVCFWKGLASEFTDPNPTHKWYPLQVDGAIGKVKHSYEAGMIQMKMTINHKTKNGPMEFKKQKAWSRDPPKRLNSCKIRIYIFQCKDLPAADDDGQSDPFISIWNPEGKEIKTQVIEDNINPIFFEAHELFYDYLDMDTCPPIVLNIWDADDGILDSDPDYLGRAVVYLKDAAFSQDNTIPEPKWHPIRIGFNESDPECGEILVSFSMVETDYSFKTPISYLKLTDEIKYQDYQVDINILGLRNLESFGLMPVKKPFIKFNLRSLLPPEKAQAVTNIKTQPSATGPNPNINTVINFNVDLPINPLFCPKLQCDVFDYVYKGLSQPLLGTFTISIGEIMQAIEKDRLDDQADYEKIVSVIEKKLTEIEMGGGLDAQDISLQFEQRVKDLDKQFDLTGRVATDNDDKDKLLGPVSESIDEEVKEGDLPEPGLLAKAQSSLSPLKNRFTKQVAKTGLFKSGPVLSKGMEAGIHSQFMLEKMIHKQTQKELMVKQREDDRKAMKGVSDDSCKNIIMPKYDEDKRLNMKRERVPPPPATLFMPLGYDPEPPDESKPETQKKHYRRFYDDELEEVKEVFPKLPFLTCGVIRGQSRGLSKGFFSFFSKSKTDDSGEVSNRKVVGQFKGKVNVVNMKEKEKFQLQKQQNVRHILGLLEELHHKKFDKPLSFTLSDLESFESTMKFKHTLEDLDCDGYKIMEFLKEQSYEEMIQRQLLVKTRCMVRVYMIEGYDFAQRDIGSFSDPYLKIKCGRHKFNERDNYQLDEPNPKFHKMYEFDAEFPGAPPLVIKAYDYDDLFGDDMIGKTVLDLDDRFFCPEWQQIQDKPVEYRQLYHPSSEISQGVVKMWLEIHMTNTSTKGNDRQWDITPQPIMDYQVRLVVYDTLDLDLSGDVEGMSDVFIKAHIDDKDKKETDCHYRCQEPGKASFNYRLLYTIKAPRPTYMLTLQVWDRDLFKSNDFMSEVQIDLKGMFDDAIFTQKPINLTKKYYENFFKEKMVGKNVQFKDDDTFFIDTFNKDGKFAGKVRIGINITPGEMATKNPVGLGRSEPNHSPMLPPPVGRLSFSLNPWTLFMQFVPPHIRKKVYLYCCLAICLTMCVALFPMVTSNILTQLIMKPFGGGSQ